MDLKVLYWTGALLNMGVIVALAWSAIGCARAGDLLSHRRRMLCASLLVVLFVGSYVLKVAYLGREDLGVW